MRPPAPAPGLVVLAVAGAGLVVLAAALHLDRAREVALGDLGAHEGARVAVTARVLAAGPRSLVLADAATRVTAFPPRHAAPPGPGDEVRAVGVVGRAAAGLVLSLERVDVLARPDERVLGVGDLAREPQRYAGAPVAVAGRLDRARGDGWRLVDPWWGASVALEASPVPQTWEVGLDLRVDGRFHLDEARLRFEVAVTSWASSP